MGFESNTGGGTCNVQTSVKLKGLTDECIVVAGRTVKSFFPGLSYFSDFLIFTLNGEMSP